MEEARTSIAELLPPEVAGTLLSAPTDEFLGAWPQAGDQSRERGLISILILGDGSRLSLDMNAGDGSRPVVYTAGGEAEGKRLISASFDEFLMSWERLRYITPSPEVLAPWLTGDDGQLVPEGGAADVLRSLYPASATIDD